MALATFGRPRDPERPTFEAPDEAEAGGRLLAARPNAAADVGFASFGLGEVMAGFTADRMFEVDPCAESEEGVRRSEP